MSDGGIITITGSDRVSAFAARVRAIADSGRYEGPASSALAMLSVYLGNHPEGPIPQGIITEKTAVAAKPGRHGVVNNQHAELIGELTQALRDTANGVPLPESAAIPSSSANGVVGKPPSQKLRVEFISAYGKIAATADTLEAILEKLCVVNIDHDPRKIVIAYPIRTLHDKELVGELGKAGFVAEGRPSVYHYHRNAHSFMSDRPEPRDAAGSFSIMSFVVNATSSTSGLTFQQKFPSVKQIPNRPSKAIVDAQVEKLDQAKLVDPIHFRRDRH